MTLEIAPTFSVPGSMDSDAVALIDSLQSYLRSSSSKSVSLNFTLKEGGRSVLEINIISAASCYTCGDLQTYLKEEKLIQSNNILISEKRRDGDIFIRCSITLE